MRALIKKLFLVLVATHFVWLALGMLRIELPWRPAFLFQHAYARVTGGGGSFGFFSPNVPREIDLEFEIEDPLGLHVATLESEVSSEVRARLTNMVHILGTEYSNERVRRAVAASFTAEMFRRHPEARSIKMNAYFYQFPTLPDYRAGRRTELKKVYSSKFRRKLT